MNTRINIRFLFVLALLGGLTACQQFPIQNYISDQNKQYLAAKEVAPLKIPAQLNSASLTDTQVLIPALPADNNPVVSAEPSLIPPGSMAAQLKAGTLPASVLKTKLPDPES